MDPHIPNFHTGDRVRAKRRADFPDGTVVQVVQNDFVVVQWDGGLVETIARIELELSDKRNA